MSNHETPDHSHQDADWQKDQDSMRDPELFDTLDRYVEFLNSGDMHSVNDLSSRHLESKDLFDCLNSLDKLSPVMPENIQSPLLNLKLDSEDSSEVTSEEMEFDPSQMFPCTFGKYELLEEIGRGGMGAVYRARQSGLDRDIALKMILSSRFASKEQVLRFYSEAKTAGKLKHPGIIGIHEAGEFHGQHYFTMTLILGKTLGDLFRDGPVEPQKAAELVSQIAKSVGHLHQNQIIHRDLKPSNILLDEEENPIVTDFGLAKILDYEGDPTQTGSIIGTPSYMPPEQASGHLSEISERSDLYSLGAILYALMTGRPPFKNDNPLDTLVDVLESEPVLPRDLNREIPRELELICMKCLEKDPENRYQSADELVADLERFLCGEPIEAKSSGIIHTLHRWILREPALATRLTGLIVAALIVQITYLILGSDFQYHMRVMTIFGAWFIWALFCQWVLAVESLSKAICYMWVISDIIFLTGLLSITESPLGALLIGYPFLIVASGLFFDVKVVWTSTFVSLIGYAILMRLRVEESNPPQYPIIFASVLAVLGMVVAYQVYRTRLLSKYFKQKNLTGSRSIKRDS